MSSTLTSETGATGPDILMPAGAVSLPVISDPTDPSLLNVHPLAYGVLNNGDIAVVGEADTEFPVVQATVSLFDSTGSLLWREPLAGGVSRTATTVLTAAVATLPTGQFWVGLNVQDGLAPLDDDAHHQLTFTRYAQDGTSSVDPFPAHPTTSNLTATGLPDGGAYFFSGNLFAGRGLGPLYQHPPAPTYVYAYSAANTFIAFDGNNGVLEHYASPYDLGALWRFTTGDANPATATAIAAMGGGRAALVWTDTTGESFLAIADTVAQTLSTPLIINQGGPSGPDHVVALWDGTFVVQLPGEYETFDSTGATGGGWHAIDTTLEGLNLYGQVFGLGVDSSGNYIARAYTIGSVSTGQTGSTGQTSATLTPANFALNYAVPPPDEGGNHFYTAGYAALPGSDEIIALALSKDELIASGYSVGGQSGTVLFQTVLADVHDANPASGVFAPSITLLANGTVAIAWQVVAGDQAGGAQDAYAVLSGSGQTLAGANLDPSTFLSDFLNFQGPPDLYATPTGFNMEWNAHSTPPADQPQKSSYEVQFFNVAGLPGARASSTPEVGGQPIAFVPHAFATAPPVSIQVGDNTPVSLQLTDNVVQVYDGALFTGAAAIPNEPAHAIADEAAAMLRDGHAALAWEDSGTVYVSVFNPASETFSATTALIRGDVLNVHVVALPDGGFAASWENFVPPFGSPMSIVPPHYQGEVFTADGVGGGVMTLAGNVAGIDSHGNLYTVDSSNRAFPGGGEYIATYAINGGGSTGGGTPGQTFTSDNNGDGWIGTPGDDTFNLGRGGDWVSGNGGNDTYRFAEVPWAGGHITDFNAGDVLDLTGLMSTTSYTGSDGFADGYLKAADDGFGSAQVWANYHIPGNDGWWLVETLDGVAPSSLKHNGDLLRVIPSTTGPTDVTTSDANYIAATSVKTITLAGSHQHIDANATNGVTINSNDSGNVLIGGEGADVFHLGRGGDVVTGGFLSDVFAYAEIPWAGGTITDFSAGQGDKLDVSGLLESAHFTGSDPFAAGYLKWDADSSGDAQLWANYNLPSNDDWWLVTTLDGIPTAWVQNWNNILIT